MVGELLWNERMRWQLIWKQRLGFPLKPFIWIKIQENRGENPNVPLAKVQGKNMKV